MAVTFAPARHRAETVREQDLRMELAVAHAEALDVVARLTPIHGALYTQVRYVSPEAVRLVGLAQREVESYRRKQGQ